MASSVSNLVNNLTEEIHKIKCKNEHCNKTCETCGIKYKDFEYFFDKQTLGSFIECKCFCCNKNYQKSLMKI